MTVPDYQTIMLPLLTSTQDGQEHTLANVLEVLAEHFQLTPEDLEERLPSGQMGRFYNRVGWARTYLAKAGLLAPTRRGAFCITQRGQEVLSAHPPAITGALLAQFAEFAAFRGAVTAPVPSVSANGVIKTQELDPDEQLDNSHQALRQVLAHELLQRVKTCTPTFFEQLVVDLLVAMGYGGSLKDAGTAVGRSGDGGVDGVIKEDRLGLDTVYLQAKRWEAVVGRPTVQTFAGSLEGFRARKGVLITTSKFSQDAHDYAGKIEKRIVLIDGEQLVQLMIEYGVGVKDVHTYVVKSVDLDYFGEE